jgi:amino acid permease
MRILFFVEMKESPLVNFQRNQNMETTKSLTVRRLTHLPFVSKFLILLHLIGLSSNITVMLGTTWQALLPLHVLKDSGLTHILHVFQV